MLGECPRYRVLAAKRTTYCVTRLIGDAINLCLVAAKEARSLTHFSLRLSRSLSVPRQATPRRDRVGSGGHDSLFLSGSSEKGQFGTAATARAHSSQSSNGAAGLLGIAARILGRISSQIVHWKYASSTGGVGG